MKSVMFDSLHQWKVCFLSGCKKFAWGLFRIVACLVFGFASVIRWLWRVLIRWVGNYPAAAVIIALAAILAVWVATYAGGKAKLVSAEYCRDSLRYELWRVTNGTDKSEQLVVGQDTVTVFSYDKP